MRRCAKQKKIHVYDFIASATGDINWDAFRKNVSSFSCARRTQKLDDFPSFTRRSRCRVGHQSSLHEEERRKKWIRFFSLFKTIFADVFCEFFYLAIFWHVAFLMSHSSTFFINCGCLLAIRCHAIRWNRMQSGQSGQKNSEIKFNDIRHAFRLPEYLRNRVSRVCNIRFRCVTHVHIVSLD